MTVVFNILRWTVAILSVAGTLALIVWIAVMILKKDQPNDASRNRH
jgi:hypothetical protein